MNTLSQKIHLFLATGTLVTIALSLVYCSVQADYISGHIERAIAARPKMQTITSAWVSGGITYTISTPWESPETPSEHRDRHNAPLTKSLETWPADS